jgi:hypothetical protein
MSPSTPEPPVPVTRPKLLDYTLSRRDDMPSRQLIRQNPGCTIPKFNSMSALPDTPTKHSRSNTPLPKLMSMSDIDMQNTSLLHSNASSDSVIGEGTVDQIHFLFPRRRPSKGRERSSTWTRSELLLECEKRCLLQKMRSNSTTSSNEDDATTKSIPRSPRPCRPVSHIERILRNVVHGDESLSSIDASIDNNNNNNFNKSISNKDNYESLLFLRTPTRASDTITPQDLGPMSLKSPWNGDNNSAKGGARAA